MSSPVSRSLSEPAPTSERDVRRPRRRPSRLPHLPAPAWGLLVAVALAALAMIVPAVLSWNIHVFHFPPLHADWDPRVGPGTVPALVVAALAAWQAVPLAERLGWRRLLALSFVVGLVWMLALAYVDGSDGIGVILGTPYEYMRYARSTTDVHQLLQEYVSRIPYEGPHNFQVHLAGHPPGAVLFFIGLVRIGLGSDYQAGMVVTVLAATTPVAVLATMRVLGAEGHARRAAPFLVLGGAAIWSAVSADALFGVAAAWGILALAVAATRTTALATAGWGLLSGLLLGSMVMMSYGMPIMGILAVLVLWQARSWRPLGYALVGSVAVVAVFFVLGFDYWEALKALHVRYWEGVASRRPPQYWMWGNLAALVFCAGPMVGASVAQAGVALPWRGTWRPGAALAGRWYAVREHPAAVPVMMTTAGVLMVMAADLSQMSRAEVERIWLPFVPWLLAGTALLPAAWRRGGLVVQLVAALAVQHLLATGW